MSYGLRVWDAGGNLTLDTTDRITRFVTSITPGTIAASTTVSYSVPGIVDDGTWFLIVPNAFKNNSFVRIYLTITSGNINLQNIDTIAWINDFSTRIEVYRG